MATRKRALSLHHSALSDAEYEAYTAALAELLSDIPPSSNANPRSSATDWESARLSVREVRGWIRGRYGEIISIKDIDKILSYFHSDQNPLGVLTGGEFFAVLRLITHAKSGKDPIHSLVFTQADPKPYFSPPPSSNPFTRSIPSSSASHTSQLSPTTSEFPTPSESAATGISVRSAPPPIRSSSFVSPSRPSIPPATQETTNPFLSRSKSVSHHPTVSPPLPPRKAKPLLPPPKHSSQASSSAAPAPAPNSASLPSGKPKPSLHPLMQQSLLVAKAGRGAQAIEKDLAAQRFSQVISRSCSAASSPTPSLSPPKASTMNGRGRTLPSSSEDSSLSSSPWVERSELRHLREPGNRGSGSGESSSTTPTPPHRPPIPPKPKPKTGNLSTSVSTLRGDPPPDSDLGPSPFDSPPQSATANTSSSSRARATTLSQNQTDYFDSTNPPPPPPRRKRPESIQVPPSNWNPVSTSGATSSHSALAPPKTSSSNPYSSSTTSTSFTTASSTSPFTSHGHGPAQAPAHGHGHVPGHQPRQLSVSNISKTISALQLSATAAKDNMNRSTNKTFNRLFRSEKEDSRRLVPSDEEDEVEYYHDDDDGDGDGRSRPTTDSFARIPSVSSLADSSEGERGWNHTTTSNPTTTTTTTTSGHRTPRPLVREQGGPNRGNSHSPSHRHQRSSFDSDVMKHPIEADDGWRFLR